MSSGNMQYLMKFATAIAAVLVCICAITVVTSAQPGYVFALSLILGIQFPFMMYILVRKTWVEVS